jgi:hypothetical protein
MLISTSINLGIGSISMSFRNSFLIIISVFHLLPDLCSGAVVASYDFTGNANDSSGNGLHGTVIGATLIADRFGNLNSAYNFDNVDDAILVQNSGGLLSLSGPFSLSAWARPSNPSSDYRNNPIIWKLAGPGDPDNYTLAWGGNSRFGSGMEDRVNGQDYGVASEAKIHGAWYHVASVYDRQSLKIYVNGVLEGVSPVLNVTPYMGGAPLRIGNIIGSTHAFAGVFDGAIDDIRIYDHALNQSDINALYETTNAVPEPSSMVIGTLLGLGGLLRKRRMKR